MQTIRRPSARAFFNGRQTLLFPATDRAFVAFQSAADWSLATPAQLLEEPIDMVGMIPDAGLPLDQIRHSGGGPHRSGVAQRLGATLQPLLQLLALDSREARLTSRPSCAAQLSRAALLPRGKPAAGRLAADAELSGHLGLRLAPRKEFGSLHPPPFQAQEITLHCRGGLHGATLP